MPTGASQAGTAAGAIHGGPGDWPGCMRTGVICHKPSSCTSACCHRINTRNWHRELMRCYYRQNDRAAAIRQYRTCVRILRDELGIGPMPETENLYQQIIN
jgi:hypothetical protein